LGDDTRSAEIKASSSSFVEVVENARVLTVVLGVVTSLEAVASMAIAARTGVVQKLNKIKLGRAAHIKLRILFMVVVLSTRPWFLLIHGLEPEDFTTQRNSLFWDECRVAS
jgi:hypothetical protein